MFCRNNWHLITAAGFYSALEGEASPEYVWDTWET